MELFEILNSMRSFSIFFYTIKFVFIKINFEKKPHIKII